MFMPRNQGYTVHFHCLMFYVLYKSLWKFKEVFFMCQMGKSMPLLYWRPRMARLAWSESKNIYAQLLYLTFITIHFLTFEFVYTLNIKHTVSHACIMINCELTMINIFLKKSFISFMILSVIITHWQTTFMVVRLIIKHILQVHHVMLTLLKSCPPH